MSVSGSLTDGLVLLESLTNLQCPGIDSLTSGDLDWIWETKGNFLDWFTLSVSREKNYLSSEEISLWNEMDKSLVLSGDALDEALANTQVESLDDLRTYLENLQEESKILEEVHSELERSLSTYYEYETKCGIKISQYFQRLEAYKKIPEAKNSFEEFDDVSEPLNSIQEVLSGIFTHFNFSDNKTSLLLSELKFESFLQEDFKFQSQVDSFIESQFNGDNNEYLTERSVKDTQGINKEMQRLKKSLNESWKVKILSDAQLEGAKASFKFINNNNNIIDNIIREDSTIDIPSVLSSSKSLESLLRNVLIQEIANEAQFNLSPIIDSLSSTMVCRIQNTDIIIKNRRQKYILDKLTLLKEYLKHQNGWQNVFILIYEAEYYKLKKLAKILEEYKKMNDFEMVSLNHDESMLSKIPCIQYKDDIFTIVSQYIKDPDIKDLHDLLKDSESLFEKSLESKSKRIKFAVKCVENQLQMYNGLKEIEKYFLIGPNYKCSLENPKLTANLHLLESKLQNYENYFKEQLSEWERDRRKYKTDPHLAANKKIWIHFLNNPKLNNICLGFQFLCT